MIEVYVLATLAAMGYLLNKSSKPDQQNTVRSKFLNVHELPSQDNIYQSNHFERVKESEQRRAAKVFEQAKNAPLNNVISKNYGGMKDVYTPSKKVKSLTGDYVDSSTLTHNNMVPFFGGNIKQNMDENSTKNIIENFTGVSEVFKNKQEVPCMYDKSKDFGNVFGMENKDDYYRDRYEESKMRNNVVPVPQIRVGPGIGKGYDAQPSGGFQQLDAQDLAMPYYKSVDDLRVASKPKMSFEARTVEGQRGTRRADTPNLVKNRVETYFEQSPDMLLKTTGAYTKPKETPEFIVNTTNRVETTREDFGIAGASVARRKVDEANVKPTSRQQLKEYGLRNTALNTYGKGNKDDYGKCNILVYNNERDITTTRVHQGNVTSLIKAIIAPIEDALRISKKEHAVDNPRHFGNMSIQVPDKPTMYDPNDIARTTIKETLLHDEMGMGAVTGPKQLTVYDPDEIAKKTIRETLERMDYEMNLGGGAYKGKVYDPDDTARTTMKETLVEETHDGNIERLEGMGTYINDYLARNTQKQFISDKDYYGIAAKEDGNAYKVTKYEARNTQKQFISDKDHYGIAAAAYQKKETSTEDIANAIITDRKEVILHGRAPTQEGRKVGIGGETVNLDVRKVECDIASKRETHNYDRVVASQIPSFTNLNQTRDRSMMDIPDDRLDPSLLKPFRDNPYTQSLTSSY